MFDFTKQWEARILINGRPVTEYHHTDGNVYLEGRKGSEYELEIVNHSYERVLVVPAVDGLSVMDGKTAGIDSDGYVVNPKQSVRIPGWRLDQGNVARFVFGDVGRGYSAQSGQGTSNSGVIGFMVFRPKPVETLSPFTVARYYSGNDQWDTMCDSFSAASVDSCFDDLAGGLECCASASLDAAPLRSATLSSPKVKSTITDYSMSPTVNPELATGFGRKDNFSTVDVTFEKRDEHNPDAIMVMYYDSLRGLEKRGIVVRREASPQAFPRYSSTKGCTPPTGWRG